MNRHGELRVVIVGAGLMGRWHGRAARRCGGRVVGVMDRDEAKAGGLARELQAPVVRTDLAELLAETTPDVAHVCTALPSHFEFATAALDGGCHVLVEKPVAPTLSETNVLLERAREKGRLLCPTHQFLFQRGALRLDAVRPSLGPLRHVGFTACSAGADEGDEGARDRVAGNILPHFLSLAERLGAGPIDEVEWRLLRSGAGEIRVAGLGEGFTAVALVSMSGRPTRNELEWIGVGGSARLDLFHGFATFERAEPSRREKLVRPFRTGVRTLVATGRQLGVRAVRWEPAFPGLQELVRQFYDAARAGGPPPIPEREVVAVARVWETLWGELRSASGVEI